MSQNVDFREAIQHENVPEITRLMKHQFSATLKRLLDSIILPSSAWNGKLWESIKLLLAELHRRHWGNIIIRTILYHIIRGGLDAGDEPEASLAAIDFCIPLAIPHMKSFFTYKLDNTHNMQFLRHLCRGLRPYVYQIDLPDGRPLSRLQAYAYTTLHYGIGKTEKLRSIWAACEDSRSFGERHEPWIEPYIQELYGLLVCLGGDDPDDEFFRRLFRIVKRLPLDLRAVLVHRAFGGTKNTIVLRDATWRRLLYVPR